MSGQLPMPCAVGWQCCKQVLRTMIVLAGSVRTARDAGCELSGQCRSSSSGRRHGPRAEQPPQQGSRLETAARVGPQRMSRGDAACSWRRTSCGTATLCVFERSHRPRPHWQLDHRAADACFVSLASSVHRRASDCLPGILLTCFPRGVCRFNNHLAQMRNDDARTSGTRPAARPIAA